MPHIGKALLITFQGLYSGNLDCLENAGIDIAFYPAQSIDNICITCCPAYTPAGHIVGLGQGMKLYADLFCSRCFQEAWRHVAVKCHFRISEIMADHDVVLFGELHHCLEKFFRRRGGSRIIRIVDKHHFGLGQHLCRDNRQVGQEIVLLQQRHLIWRATGKHGGNCIDRIGRARHQGHITGVYKGQRNMGNPLLGTDQGYHLLQRVKFHTGSILIPAGNGLPEAVHAGIARVPVIGRHPGSLGKLVDDVIGGRQVRVTNPEINNIDAASPGLCLFSVQFRKKIWRQLFQSVCLFNRNHFCNALLYCFY